MLVLVAGHPAATRAQADLLGMGDGTAASPAPEAAAPIAVGADGPSDAQIGDRLRGIFGVVDELGMVAPSVRSGVVILAGSSPDAASAATAVELAARVEGVVTVIDRIERSAALQQSFEPGLERLNRRLRDGVRLLPMIGVGAAIFLAFVLAGGAVARWRAPFERVTPNRFVAELAAQALRAFLAMAGLVLALDFVGATSLLGAILGAAGILGLAIGFGVRDTIENYVASVLLSVRRPFAPNDLVSIEGHEGFVVGLTSRATVLLTPEGNHVRIPNATVFKGTIVNYTRNPERRFDFALGVNADASLKEALDLGIRSLDSLAFTLAEPRPGAWIETVGDSSVVIRFVGWVDQTHTDFLQARSEAIRLVKRALEGAGFELPEPIYRVRMQEPVSSPAQQERRRPDEPAEAVDTTKLGSIERRATEERRQRADDLLKEPAALE